MGLGFFLYAGEHFPFYPHLTHLCQQRVYLHGKGSRHLTWDAFFSKSLPSELLDYYHKKLGDEGFTKENDGGSWVQPDEVLTVMSIDTDGPYRNCKKSLPQNSRSIIIISRTDNLNERQEINGAKTWALEMEYHGAVVRNPISTTVIIDSSRKIALKKSDQSKAQIKNITEEELNTLKTAISKAHLLNQRDVDYVHERCVGSKGATVSYALGEKTNKFEIHGSALCNIKSRKLKNLVDEIKQLQIKYFYN